MGEIHNSWSLQVEEVERLRFNKEYKCNSSNKLKYWHKKKINKSYYRWRWFIGVIINSIHPEMSNIPHFNLVKVDVF